MKPNRISDQFCFRVHGLPLVPSARVVSVVFAITCCLCSPARGDQASASGWDASEPQPALKKALPEPSVSPMATQSARLNTDEPPKRETSKKILERNELAAPLHSVALSNELPALNPKLVPGAQFDESLLPKPVERNEWVRIPDWIAGTWDPDNECEPGETAQECAKRLKKLEHSSHPHISQVEAWSSAKLDFSQIESFGSRGINGFFGCQSDREKHIWERSFIFHRTHYDEYGYHAQEIWEIEQVLPEKVVVRNQIIGVKTDEEGKITSVGQAEHIYTYTPMSSGERLLTVHSRAFNAKGKQIGASHTSRQEHLISSFHAINDFEDDNLAASFNTFLHGRGSANLVPARDGG